VWFLGYPDQALRRIYQALTLARELSHPVSLVYALHFVASLHQLRREERLTQERAEEVLALSNEQRFSLFLEHGTILRGWALATQGQGEEGIVQMRQGLVALRAIGAELWRSCYLPLLAEEYVKAGQVEEGLSVVTEALVVVDKNEERLYEAELYRLKGELTLEKSGVRSPTSEVPNTQPPTSSTQAEAEECFHKALEIARRQSAKSLELAPRRASPDSGSNKANRKQLTSFCPTSTTGSPKGLIRRICERRERSSKN
jgi:predicted ATPase